MTENDKKIDCFSNTEWHFDEQFRPAKFDVKNTKFYDDDGNQIKPTEWVNTPTLTLGEDVVLAIEFPDGRVIKNPSAEQVKEWAKGTQIPVYIISEDKYEPI